MRTQIRYHLVGSYWWRFGHGIAADTGRQTGASRCSHWTIHGVTSRGIDPSAKTWMHANPRYAFIRQSVHFTYSPFGHDQAILYEWVSESACSYRADDAGFLVC